MCLEFNYIHELFQLLSDLVIKKTGTYDWGSLFSLYDKNKDNLLDKNELKELVITCYPDVTDAEV